ncbi:hypothetical protein WALSEDRAFT_58513 [Wallemia mellicola CBS 633.66]|uniref:PIN domain-containing protein n=1 Tax=Wallemia mellicola (strain ATCC MYA-4683 / CBS 633.66) TaxID=671144 RepID=I4Y738_WALMC|nr:hypothetical protein WALSEDRAFT_58513 [Wallemia mellicola CBS 633.66]EIM19780.1 hypothetical protein WALSEDRAFT_58513 [Wallemia mellicola CBS 633.66]|eukprot:XP_006960114.1 hypothetical protein WALSEDRAFT_58513 [Wallemia mellicola CBS 633.66]
MATDIQKLMGQEFLKYKVNNLENKVKDKSIYLVDITSLIFGLNVIKLWLKDGYTIYIPLYTIYSLDELKQSDNIKLEKLSRSASSFIEKELNKRKLHLQSIEYNNNDNHFDKIKKSLSQFNNQTQLVIATPTIETNYTFFDIKNIESSLNTTGYPINHLLPAEIEEANLYFKQKKLNKYKNN